MASFGGIVLQVGSIAILTWLEQKLGYFAKGVGYLVKDPYLHIKNGNGIHNFGWPF